VAAAAIESGLMDEDRLVILEGGCNTIHPTGMWPTNLRVTDRNGISMRRAYGRSCNGFFANVIVNDIGLGGVAQAARKFGWMGNVGSDFFQEPSPITLPDPQGASTQAVGRFGAGFGQVDISTVHAAWIGMVLANDGVAKPIHMFRDSRAVVATGDPDRVVSAETARRVREIMGASVHGGTAAAAFRDARYREVRELAGGKTGTLIGHSPKALTTLFLGLMPIDKPEVVVATIVAVDGPWRIKAAQLAAESFRIWYELRMGRDPVAAIPRPSKRSARAH
jgi:cell division protein FtsI/penicillin-binding protein 2